MKQAKYNSMKRYQNIDLEAKVDDASPHQLIDLLLQGARSQIATAQGHIQRENVKGKGESISKAISIIEGLKACLDHEQGGDIAKNLNHLYDYIQQIIISANAKNDPDLLAQANLLLADIHEAWQGIQSNPQMPMDKPNEHPDPNAPAGQ